MKPNKNDWEDFIEEVKRQKEEYGDEERIKEQIKAIIDLIPEKYKKELIGLFI